MAIDALNKRLLVIERDRDDLTARLDALVEEGEGAGAWEQRPSWSDREPGQRGASLIARETSHAPPAQWSLKDAARAVRDAFNDFFRDEAIDESHMRPYRDRLDAIGTLVALGDAFQRYPSLAQSAGPARPRDYDALEVETSNGNFLMILPGLEHLRLRRPDRLAALPAVQEYAGGLFDIEPQPGQGTWLEKPALFRPETGQFAKGLLVYD